MKDLFDQLQADAGRRSLPEPSELRLISDRRTARRRTASGLAAVAVLAGSVVSLHPLFPFGPQTSRPDLTISRSPVPLSYAPVPDVVGKTQDEAVTMLASAGFEVLVKEGSELDPGDPRIGRVEEQVPKQVPAKEPTKTVTIWIATEVRCLDEYPASLPTSLFVGVGGNEICFEPNIPSGEPVFPAEESLPRPCEPMTHASDAHISDRRGFASVYSEDIDGVSAPTRYDQTITRYREDAAGSYLEEIRDAVESCGPITRGGIRITYTVVASAKLGDDRLMLEVEYRKVEAPEAGPRVSTYLVSIVRVADFVSVIYDKGWEGTPSQPSTIEHLADDVVQRLAKAITDF